MSKNRTDLINNYTEESTSSPKRIRPTDEQMGLGKPLSSFSKTKKNNSDNIVPWE